MKKLFNIFAVIILSSSFYACHAVQYAEREDFDMKRKAAGNHMIEFNKKGYDGGKKYGGLILTDFNEETKKKEGEYFITMKRNGTRFYTEALLFHKQPKETSMLDQAFFDIGLDKNKKSLDFNVTFRY